MNTILLSSFNHDHTTFVVEEPERCRSCGSCHVVFINREGRTTCIGCDAKRKEAA